MDIKIRLIFLQVILFKVVTAHWRLNTNLRTPSVDPVIIENALNPDLCREQLEYITNPANTLLRLQFIEAGLRLPKGILQLNTRDLGNYDQCLSIHEELDESVLDGKYCAIRGPIDENFARFAKIMQWSEFDKSIFFNEDRLQKLRRLEKWNEEVDLLSGKGHYKYPRSVPGESFLSPTFNMALCIPKSCTTQEGIKGIYQFNLTELLGFNYEEQYCRVVGDKPWAAADYIAITIFSLIGCLTILSTGYDVWYQLVARKDIESISTVLRSFSVYTNGKQLTTFRSNSNTLQCVDGIRTISMLWIVVGHTYILMPPAINTIDTFTWILDLKSLWLTAAPYTVDTFFFLSGLLVVYTTTGKMNGNTLFKKLHLFYLNRVLRMLPILASAVLIQSSIFNRAVDGPNWASVEANTNNCRKHWWATLMYIQNFVGYDEQCFGHSWYLAIDMHCYFVSPFILYWVLNGNKKHAWISLTCGLLVSLSVATTYSFVYQFSGWILGDTRGRPSDDYHYYYYFNTLTRAPPFFLGMIFGYLLHVWKGQEPQIPKIVALLLWLLCGSLAFVLMYVTHLMKDSSWSAYVVDDLVNSFARSLWALTVGWVIFACHYGYGGPVNWFLTLDMWKLPSRISYAIYLFHFPIQYVIQGTARTQYYFSDGIMLYNFLSQAVIAFGFAFGITLIVDSPFSVLFKLLLGDGPKTPTKKSIEKE